MEKELVLEKRLDSILCSISNNFSSDIDNIRSILDEDLSKNLSDAEINGCIDKLIKDGYLYSPIPNKHFSINEVGKDFIHNKGGYEQKAKTEILLTKNSDMGIALMKRSNILVIIGILCTILSIIITIYLSKK